MVDDEPSDVAVLRRFNRSHTQRIGVLSESYLGTGRPLGPSRVLFEIGPDGVGVAELRRRLGLDSGYLSRLLRQLERESLVSVGRDPHDGRQRVVRLTSAGRRAHRHLDRRADDLARRLVAPLSVRQRDELTSALAIADRLLRAATVELDVVDPADPAAAGALRRYVGELDVRFRSGFDRRRGGVDDVDGLRPPDGVFVLARSDDVPVGCGGLVRVDDRTGEIKRMWIDPEWRGLGLGRRLLAELEGAARDLGRRRVILDTNAALLEAIAMYGRAGYRPVERYNDNPYADHWFTKDL